MAKTAEKQEVQTVNAQVPVSQEMLDAMERDAGQGVSYKQEDQLLPLIYVLQSNSPVTEKRSDNHVEGAEPGHFWLRNSITPIRDGVVGIDVIPVEMVRTWIEWMPNRQGFVARHDEQPADMVEKMIRDETGREKMILVRSGNGNIIQDTREFFLMCEGQPYDLPCTGTKHTFARQWQTFFHQFRHPKTRIELPAFSHKYRLTTVPMSNAIGKWFGLRFQDLGMVDYENEYKPAKMFYDAIKRGEKRAEAPMAGVAGGTKEDDIPF
jgi:hypothetical protein